jgi:hypothetical protein
VTEVHVADEAELLERLEVAVDRRVVYGGARAAESRGDLLDGDRPRGDEQRLDDSSACCGHAQAARSHCPDDAVEVGSGEDRAGVSEGHLFRGNLSREGDLTVPEPDAQALARPATGC